jgi:hypothetical protein
MFACCPVSTRFNAHSRPNAHTMFGADPVKSVAINDNLCIPRVSKTRSNNNSMVKMHAKLKCWISEPNFHSRKSKTSALQHRQKLIHVIHDQNGNILQPVWLTRLLSTIQRTRLKHARLGNRTKGKDWGDGVERSTRPYTMNRRLGLSSYFSKALRRNAWWNNYQNLYGRSASGP